MNMGRANQPSPKSARYAALACKIAAMDDPKPVTRRVAISCGVVALVAGLALCLSLVAAAAYFTLAG
jgi:hypothetical protein